MKGIAIWKIDRQYQYDYYQDWNQIKVTEGTEEDKIKIKNPENQFQ